MPGHVGGLSPLYGGLFLHVEGTFFRCYFLRVAVIFSPYMENVLGLSTVQLTKISHAFATRVVPNMSPWGNLGEIARLNQSVKTFWSTYLHIMFIKSMK